MEKHSGVRFRQVMIAASPTAAAVVLLAATAANPWQGSLESDPTAYYTSLVAEPGRALTQTLLFAFGFLLLVPAFFGMLQLTRRRGTKLGNAGWVFGTIGFGLMAGMAAVIDIYDLVIAQEIGVAEAVAIGEKLEALPAVGVIGMLGFGAYLGTLLMAAALWRSREVPVWSAAGLATWVIGFIMLPPQLIPMLAASTALFVAAVPVSLRLLRRHDFEPGGPVVRAPAKLDPASAPPS